MRRLNRMRAANRISRASYFAAECGGTCVGRVGLYRRSAPAAEGRSLLATFLHLAAVAP